MVLRGREKGKTGKVIKVVPEKAAVIIEKLNVVKRHQKPSKKYQHGGILEKEAPMSISNISIICDRCKGATRVGRKFLDDGRKVRFCRKCGEVLDR
ncbi:MAG: 50S ribosomal protein L24 [Deltaproteobacteria bacterium]|nr:50S ribosomal protein L24 [Deltaproteobacteria bacterium]